MSGWFKPLGERFMEKVERTDQCWIWRGAVGSTGYGTVWSGSATEAASRVSYRLFHGPIEGDLQVLHRCDNPLCVRPSHLFLGTHQDNMRDRDLKGRAAKMAGEKNPRAVLNEAAVRAIRQSGELTRVLAGTYGVSMSTIQRARKGAGWTHL